MPAHGIALVPDVVDDLVEKGIGAAVGGDDGESAAPLGDGFRDAVEEALILMEGELIHFDMAAFAGEGVGIGGDAVNAAAIGEFEDTCGEVVFVIQDDDAKIDGGDMKNPCPIDTILEVKAGQAVVAGGDPDVKAGFGGTDLEDGVEGIGFGYPGRGGGSSWLRLR